MSIKTKLIHACISAYRKTPFHPKLTKPGMKLLSVVQGEKIHQKRVQGFMVNLDTTQWIDSLILNSENFEPGTTRIVRSLLRPGDTFVDVGANIGWFSLLAASMHDKEVRVFAFEPSDWTYDRFCKNIHLNGFDNIHAFREAVGKTEDTADLMLPCGYRLDGKNTATRQTVPITTLDKKLAGEQVDLIKIDTDGFEIDVIHGAAAVIRNQMPTIIFEVMTITDREKTRSVMKFLHDLGYTIATEEGEHVEDAAKAVSEVPTGTMNLVASPPGTDPDRHAI
jgi:FkbM family methyltransferase